MSTGSHPLLLVSAAARELDLHPRLLRRAIRRGELPAFRVGSWNRVRLADVERWLRSLRSGHDRPGAGLLDELVGLIEKAIELGGGFSGPVRPDHQPLSRALDLIAAEQDREDGA
jgi:excisionase family DNA binding protein